MKRVLVLLAVVGVAVYATAAWSASAPTPTEKQLLRDVATLKSQVKKLQAQEKTATANINTVGSLAATAVLYTVCSDELTADALQGTWQIVDQVPPPRARPSLRAPDPDHGHAPGPGRLRRRRRHALAGDRTVEDVSRV